MSKNNITSKCKKLSKTGLHSKRMMASYEENGDQEKFININ